MQFTQNIIFYKKKKTLKQEEETIYLIWLSALWYFFVRYFTPELFQLAKAIASIAVKIPIQLTSKN